MGCTMGSDPPKRQEHLLEPLLTMIYRELVSMRCEVADLNAKLAALVVEVDEDGQPVTNGDTVN
jgi:hypothetical protein